MERDQIITRISAEIEYDAIDAAKWVGLALGGTLLVALFLGAAGTLIADIAAHDDAEMKRTGMPCNSALMDRAWGAGIACREEARRRGLLP